MFFEQANVTDLLKTEESVFTLLKHT